MQAGSSAGKAFVLRRQPSPGEAWRGRRARRSAPSQLAHWPASCSPTRLGVFSSGLRSLQPRDTVSALATIVVRPPSSLIPMALPISPDYAPARRVRLGPVIAIALWTLAIGAGFRVLVDYELHAGEPAAAPDQWPADCGLRLDSTRANLVLFAHPQCPCSRASMAELAAILTRCPKDLRVTVCFFDPEGEPDSWTHSSLWRTAAAMPGVEVIADRNARLAARFGSSTSGQVFLFDREGRRIFSGGITGARGHEGENRGRNLVIALARGELCTASASPVFGCSLHDAPAKQEDCQL